jgi:hypothetical protein
MTKPGFRLGALVGLLLIAPLMVVGLLVSQLTKGAFTFPVNDLFNLTRDLGPGALVTLTIDTIKAITEGLNLGRVDVVAKLVEQGMLILIMLVAGMVIGGLVFWLAKTNRSAYLYGMLIGAAFGVALAARAAYTFYTFGRNDFPVANSIWLVGLFTLWGIGLGWAYERLNLVPTTTAQRTT